MKIMIAFKSWGWKTEFTIVTIENNVENGLININAVTITVTVKFLPDFADPVDD